MKNRKKTGSDRKWIAAIILLLIAEIIWLFADLQWINFPIFFKKLTSSGSKVAGHVLTSKNELKRRGVNSLIWEKTRENEVLYYFDSVLTLSQSSAKLYLKDQTELQLSENTLITLEEPDDRTKSEIRLRFSKGDFKARNPFTKTAIKGDQWTMNLDKGSEVQLRKDADSYEFEVLSGQATLQTPAGTETLNENSIVQLGGDQKLNKIEKNVNLQWTDKKPLRLYILEDNVQVPLQWTGRATKIEVARVGEATAPQEVSPQQNSTELKLKPGSYNLRLGDEKGLSGMRTIEIWQAPRIFLKKPLPRDRLKVGEDYEFVWTADATVKEFHLQLTGASGMRLETTSQNFKILRFDKEDDLEWKVEGVDDEGFVIPALYPSKIYLREQPLEAPKLKAPTIQLPDSGHFFWLKILLPEAAAAKSKTGHDVYFEWEPVTGANKYTIEISSDAGFRNPEIIASVTSTEFVWKNYDPKKKYYWRVAAAASSGRMGLFSEPAEVLPSMIKKSAPVQETATVPPPKAVVAEVKPEVPKETPKEIAKELPVEAPKVEVAPEPKKLPEILPGWGIAWAPAYRTVSLPGDLNSKVQLAGGVPVGLQLEYQTSPKENQHYYNFKLWGSSQLWKPNSLTEIPLQPNLNINEAWLVLNRHNSITEHVMGLSLHQSFIPQRETANTISARPVLVAGFRYGVHNYGITLGTSGVVHEVNLDAGFKRHFPGSGFYYGSSVNVLYQNNKSGGGYQGNLIFLLGFDQF